LINFVFGHILPTTNLKRPIKNFWDAEFRLVLLEEKTK